MYNVYIYLKPPPVHGQAGGQPGVLPAAGAGAGTGPHVPCWPTVQCDPGAGGRLSRSLTGLHLRRGGLQQIQQQPRTHILHTGADKPPTARLCLLTMGLTSTV